MIVNIVIQLDVANGRAHFDAEAGGSKLSKLELAHHLTQFAGSLILEGAVDAGNRLILPAGPALFPDIKRH